MRTEVDDNFIDVPFEEFDCWQFICLYYRHVFGVQLPTYEKEYENAWDEERISALYEREVVSEIWPRVDEPQYPDIAVFKVDGKLWHAGIVVGDNYMLHTQKGCNSVIERYDNLRWRNRLYGFYHYAG